jgi:hypothetical protein
LIPRTRSGTSSAVLTAQGLPAPLTIGQVAVEVDGDRIAVTIWGELVGAELLAAIVDHLTAWRRYLSANPYAVQVVASDGRVQVQPADARAAAYPDAPALGHAPGLPGASYTLAAGASVVVAHLAGDPGSAVVVAHLAGVLPVSVVLDASSFVSLGAGGTPLALASKADARDAALLAGVNAALTALSLPNISLPASSAATKARGA